MVSSSPPKSAPKSAPLSPDQIKAALREAAAQLDAGDLKGAGKLLNDIRRTAPNHPDVLHLSGLVALRAQNPALAEKFIRLAVAQAPSHAFMQVNLANALRRQGKIEEALATFAKAVSLDPAFAGTYLNRGILLSELGRKDEARADFEEAIKRAPAEPGGYAQLAQHHLRAGDFHAMAEAYKRGLEALPAHAHFLAGLATAYERLSDLEAAKPLADQALAALPHTPMALKVWASVTRRLGRFEEVKDRLEKVAIGQFPPHAARLIHAELAQVYDRLGDTQNAYSHFARQNEMAKKQAAAQGIDKASYMAQVTGLTEAFQTGLGKSWPETGRVTEGHANAPVFLVGFPRSGTTLLDQILDAHPDVQVIEERPVLLAVRDAVAALPGGYPGALEKLDEASLEDLRARYWAALRQEGAELETKTVINKLPLNIIHAGLIHRVFPEAKFILALRHPLDAVLSCFMQDFEVNASMAHFLDIGDAAKLYEAVMGLWQLYEGRFALDKVAVKYEELIGDVEGAVRPVLAHLGLAWNPAQLEHVAHAKARGTIRTPSYAQVTEPIYQRAAARYERYSAYLESAERRLAPFVAAFGYS
ncbi:sulfotransferase [Tepidicaulis marinus]|uniref:Sulfotransferase n=1 Tax=Tepidicaulis marinus TaxID=1333998 RepID=A0A081B6L7_9HYPH|nr:tetratricopeptide repeat-containing sulfotransferase family protein [Tepidicaulis marinus]GAK43685.1 sulfotransferase [Tepidicaulis marinus]